MYKVFSEQNFDQIDFLKSSFDRILKGIYDDVKPFGFYWTTEELIHELKTGAKVIAELEGDEMVAFASFRIVSEVVDIGAVATNPRVKRQGRMRKLMLHLMEVEDFGKTFWLEVHERNFAAQDLYTKLGFKFVGKRNAYYRDGGAALLMSKP